MTVYLFITFSASGKNPVRFYYGPRALLIQLEEYMLVIPFLWWETAPGLGTPCMSWELESSDGQTTAIERRSILCLNVLFVLGVIAV